MTESEIEGERDMIGVNEREGHRTHSLWNERMTDRDRERLKNRNG